MSFFFIMFCLKNEARLHPLSTRAAKHSIRNSLAASQEEAFDLSSWHNNNQACRAKRVHLFITLLQMHDVVAGECAATNPTSVSTRPLLNLSNPLLSSFYSIFLLSYLLSASNTPLCIFVLYGSPSFSCKFLVKNTM